MIFVLARRRAFTACLAAIALGWASASGAVSCKRSVPFESPGRLVLKLQPGHANQLFPDAEPVYFSVGPDAGKTAEFPSSGAAKLYGYDNLQALTVVGTWADLLGDLAVGAGLIWRYDDVIRVKDDKGKQYLIKREKLKKYPNLLQRLEDARVQFDTLEISFRAHSSDPAERDRIWFVTLKLTHQDVVMAEEGKTPPMPMAIPDTWLGNVTIAENRGLEQKPRPVPEQEMAATWRRFGSARCFGVTVLGLREPRSTLVQIAKLYEQYEKDDKALNEEFALLKEGYKPPRLPAPYTRGGERAKPFEEPIRAAEVFTRGNRTGLRTGDRIVFESNTHFDGRPLDERKRFFRFSKSRMEYHEIYSARGERLEVGGHTNFRRIEAGSEPGTWLLSAYNKKGAKAYSTKKDYSGPPSPLSETEFTNFKARDSNGRCASGGSGVSFHGGAQYYYVRGTLLVVDRDFRLLRSEPAYFAGGQLPSYRGRRICHS